MPTTSGRQLRRSPYNCPFCFGAIPTPAQGGPFDREPEPVHRREDLQPGIALHVATRSTTSRGSRARISSTPSASSPPATSGGPGRRRPAGLSRRRSLIRPIRMRPTPTSPSCPTRRTTTPGRCSAMPPTSSTSNGSSMPRCATTKISGRTPPTRRTAFLPAARWARLSPARFARTPSARRSPRPRCATSRPRT